LLDLLQFYRACGASSDETTALQMVYFYRNLLAGMAKDEALREAQLALMKEYPIDFLGAIYSHREK